MSAARRAGVEIRDGLPKNALGKILKDRLVPR
jgi:hypothetical protein